MKQKAKKKERKRLLEEDEEHCFKILVTDDAPAIHDDIKKILASPKEDTLATAEEKLFNTPQTRKTYYKYKIESAFQGQDALKMVEQAYEANDPYFLAFVDMRMPPGWDGLETVENIWAVDPRLQIVIITAYSDHNWTDLINRLGRTDSLLVLKKPFDSIEILQMTFALAEKWGLERSLNSWSRRLMRGNRPHFMVRNGGLS